MTREEAIKQLDTMWKMLTSAYDDIADSHVAAYTMAVDALKAQADLQQSCNQLATDTISRQAAIDEIEERKNANGYRNVAVISELNRLEGYIMRLPSAQPKPCEDAVSRQTLQKELALYPIDDVTSEDEAGYNRAITDVQKMVLHLPSAQPEIIRCRDCKYWREHKYAKETKRYIPFCGFNAIYTKADDFCSRAERRIDE